MKKFNSVLAFVVFVAVLAVAGSAFARYIGSYDLIVPRLGGTAYSGTLTKVNYSRGVDNNTSNGAGYTMYSAIYHPSTTRDSELLAPVRRPDTAVLQLWPEHAGHGLSPRAYEQAHDHCERGVYRYVEP